MAMMKGIMKPEKVRRKIKVRNKRISAETKSTTIS